MDLLKQKSKFKLIYYLINHGGHLLLDLNKVLNETIDLYQNDEFDVESNNTTTASTTNNNNDSYHNENNDGVVGSDI